MSTNSPPSRNLIPMSTNSRPPAGSLSNFRRVEVKKWFLEPARSHNNQHPKVRLWGQTLPPHPRGLFLRSSPIANRLSHNLLETRNGSEIKLTGPICKPLANKQGMSSQGIATFTNGFPTSWRDALSDVFPTRDPTPSSLLGPSFRPIFMPSPPIPPLRLSIRANLPDPEQNSPRPQLSALSRQQPSNRTVIQTHKSSRITRSKSTVSAQPSQVSNPETHRPSQVSNPETHPDTCPTERPIQNSTTKPRSRKENPNRSAPIQTRTRCNQRSTLPPSQPVPPSIPPTSHSDERTQPKPASRPGLLARKRPGASQVLSSRATKRPKRSQSSIAKPPQHASQSGPDLAPPVKRSKKSATDSAPMTRRKQSTANSAPVTRSKQSTASSAPVTRSKQSTASSAPVTRSKQSTASSAPVTRSKQSTDYSAPVTRSKQSNYNSAPVTRSKRSTDNSAPVTRSKQSTADPAPVTRRKQPSAKSAPVTRRTQSNANSAPATRRTQSNANSAPVTRKKHSTSDSAPEARSKQSTADFAPAGPATRASRNRKPSTNVSGTKEKGAQKKILRSAKSLDTVKEGSEDKEDSTDGAGGLLAQRLRKAQEARAARRSRRVLFVDRSSEGTAQAAATPKRNDKVESRRAGTPGRAMRGDVEAEGWTAEQLKEYEMRRNMVAADEMGYWDKVAEGVSGKSGDDCRRLWEGTWSSAQEENKKKEKRVSTPEMVSGLLKAGKTARGRETGKFRTRARMLADRVASGLEDDVMEPLVSGGDDVETPRNVAGVEVGTPGTVVREKRKGLEEAGRLETPEILSRGRNVGFEEADRYVGGFWRRARQGGSADDVEVETVESEGEEGNADVEKGAEGVGIEMPSREGDAVEGDVYSDEEEPFF